MNTSSNAVPSPESGTPTSTNPPAAPALSVVPEPKPRPARRSIWNQEQLREITIATDVVAAAQKTIRVAPLKTRKILPAFVTQLADDANTACQLNTTVLASDVGGLRATQQGADCEQKLIGSLRRIQTAARQEYKHTDPLKLKEYLIGQDIAASRPVLEQSALTLLDKAGTERPAGLDTEFLVRVEAERAAYTGTDARQTDENSEAQQERVQRQTLIDSIKQRRQTIQLAAEFLWPSTDPANAPTRREFGLPPTQPYLS